MLNEIVKRFLYLIPIILGVIFLSFIIMHAIPGNPAEVILGLDATPENVAKLEKEMGLDKPLLVQYALYIKRLLHGDLGYSYRTERTVSEEIRQRYPNTIMLAAVALLFVLFFGGITGIFCALKPNSKSDFLLRGVSVIGISLPEFWSGFLFILLFAVYLHWLPSEGKYGLTSFILPGFTLALSGIGMTSRLIRSSLLEVLKEPYIRTARSKGVSKLMIVIRHALKNAMIPAITIMGFQLGRFLGSAVVVEMVFNWPGMGRLAIEGIMGRDVPVVQAAILLLALTYVVINLIADILYIILDPRIRYS
ncbi:MAG: ABC transporter permease [Deltaproteobacteria bacterium]|nr:ABC transporter permease [Deltaproteobacteria bacterium]